MAQRERIRPAILGQYRRQPGELKTIHRMVFCLALLGLFLLIPFFYAQKQKPFKRRDFSWRRERDSNPFTVPRKHDFQSRLRPAQPSLQAA